MILGLRTPIDPAKDLAGANGGLRGVAPCVDEAIYVGFGVGGCERGLLPDATPGAAVTQPLGNRYGMIDNPHFDQSAVR